MAQGFLPLLPPPEKAAILSWMMDTVIRPSECNFSNGLAIIIGCTNSCKRDHPPLKGVQADLHNLMKTFKLLKFMILCLDDPTTEHIKNVIACTSDLKRNGIKLPDSWRRIVVTFSSHGDEKFLYARNSYIDLKEDIIIPLMPENAKELAEIPKLFFIDACRGPDVDEGVDISNLFHRQGPVARGSERVPSRGNIFIAYSTLLGMRSFEWPVKGGYWVLMLCEELVNEENIHITIPDVMTRVNRKLIDFSNIHDIPLQQPEFKSTLSDDIKLLKEAMDLDQQQQQQLQLQQLQHQPASEAGQGYYQHLGMSATPQYPGAHLPMTVTEQQQFEPPMTVQFGQQQFDPAEFSALLPKLQPVFEPHWQFGQQQFAPHGQQQFEPAPAAGFSALQPVSLPESLALQQQQSEYQQHGLGISASTSEGLSYASTAPLQHRTSEGFINYRGKLNECVHANIISQHPDYKDNSDLTNNDFRISVTVFMDNSQKIVGRGSSSKNKATAKEEAAKEAWGKIQGILSQRKSQPQERESRGVAKPKSLHNKVWKSKLKEYFDSKYKGNSGRVDIQYDTKSESNGYRSTVFCTDLGYATGDLCPSKQQAEQSAAKKACERLKIKN